MNEIVDQIKNDDSYAIRRKIFKNVWDAAMQLDGVDAKPKVIKTVRLEESARSLTRTKKQRIKNLRTVCKKILEFCDRQDAEDLFINDALPGGVAPKLLKPNPIPKARTKYNKQLIKKDEKSTNEVEIKNNKCGTKKQPLQLKQIEPQCLIVARTHLKHIKKTSLEVNKKKKT